MSLVMHTCTTKQKKVDDFKSELWKMLRCHLLICRMLPLLTQEALERDRKFNKYSVLDKGKNRDRHAWLMPDA